MLTMNDMNAILSEVSFGGWEFIVKTDWSAMSPDHMRGRPYLQIRATTPCNVTGDPMSWSGRKWFLSHHMTKSELVQTAFKAVLTAVEHEAREQFTYKGVSIFDPHYDVDRLVELRGQANCLDEREDAA